MIRVSNFMTRNVITIHKNADIKQAAKLMISKSVSGLVVVENNSPIGVISENDILRGVVLKKRKVADVMIQDFLFIQPSQSLYQITKLMNQTKIKKFPVVSNGKLVGLITETDIIEATRDLTRFHQILLEIILILFGLATAFFLFYFSPLGRAVFGYTI